MVMAQVMADTKMLTDVMKDICPVETMTSTYRCSTRLDKALLHPGRDHRPGESKEDGAVRIPAHLRPDLKDSPSFLPWNPVALIPSRRRETSFVGETGVLGFISIAGTFVSAGG